MQIYPGSRGPHPRVRLQRGVTLIELLITVAIVAIIAAVAIPSYNNYVLRAHRTEAKSALLSMAAAEERFYSTNNAYTNDPSKLGYTPTTFSPPVIVGNGYYSISQSNLAAATTTLPATYTLTATAIGGQAWRTQHARPTPSIKAALRAPPAPTPPQIVGSSLPGGLTQVAKPIERLRMLCEQRFDPR